VPDQVAVPVELENRRANMSDRRRWRDLVGSSEPARWMIQTILGIYRHADGLTENPMVRQRLQPERVDFGHHCGRLHDASVALLSRTILPTPRAASTRRKIELM
jgi:hypothetical protein